MIRALKGWYHLLIAIVALLWFRFPGRHLTVIGVTGTDGKTTTSTLIYEILKANRKRVSMITTVYAEIAGNKYDTGFHVTTPSPWWVQKYLRYALDHGDTHVVLEVTSHALSQYRVYGIPFAVGLLTNVTHEHLDWHKTIDHYFQTKLTLLAQSRIAIMNNDQEEFVQKARAQMPDKKIITYGIHHGADVTPRTIPFVTMLPGEFNQYNCLAALVSCRELGIDMKIARGVISTFKGVVGRMEIIAPKPYMVIVDFAHTPNALEQVLKTVRFMTKKRLIHVFGSAGLRDHTKRPKMGEASGRYADLIILTEEDYRTEDVHEIIAQIQEGIPKNKRVFMYPKRDEAIRFAIKSARPGDLVIITGKGHEKSLCRGTVEYPWSDQEEVKKILQVFNRNNIHAAKKV